MIERDLAVYIQKRALRAIEMLTEIFNLNLGQCSPDEYMQIKRGIASSIIAIQTELLDNLYKDHPDIDHLR